MVVAERLRKIRAVKKLSQAEAEKKAGPLLCFLSRVENGHQVPGVDKLKKVARALGVPLYHILYKGPQPALKPSRTGGKLSFEGVKGSEIDLGPLIARLRVLAEGRRNRVIQSPTVEEKQNIRKYHRLADKKLQGNASSRDLEELERIESRMRAIEKGQTSGIEEVLEQRHRAMMEKLTNLTEELRRSTTVTEQ
jgi:transcriptional regulator with XRE-family HTH domain